MSRNFNKDDPERLDREHGLMLQLVGLDSQYQEVLSALLDKLEPESRAVLACDSQFSAMLRRVDSLRFKDNPFGLHFADLGRPPVSSCLSLAV